MDDRDPVFFAGRLGVRRHRLAGMADGNVSARHLMEFITPSLELDVALLLALRGGLGRRVRVGASAAAAEGWRVSIGIFAIRELLCADAQGQPGRDPEGLRPMPKRMDAEWCLLRGDASTALGVYS